MPAKLLHGSADDAPPSNLGVACDDVTHLSAGGGDLVALVVDSGLRVVVVQLSPSPTILQRVLYSSKVRLVALHQAPSKDRVELVALCVDGFECCRRRALQETGWCCREGRCWWPQARGRRYGQRRGGPSRRGRTGKEEKGNR